MISPTDTAYPVLTASPSAGELTDAFTPDVFELKFAEERTREAASRVGILALLKTFQRLGYSVKLADIPLSIIRTVTQTAGYDAVPSGLDHYDQSTPRVRHMALVRSWAGVSAYDRSAFKTIVKSCVEASRVREDLADIINIAIEELRRHPLPHRHRQAHAPLLPDGRAAGFIRPLVPHARMGTHRQHRPDAQRSLPFPRGSRSHAR